MKLLYAVPLIIVALLFTGAYFGLKNKDDSLPSAREGGSVPALTLTAFGAAEPFTVDELADGEVVLVNFWASWCGPCRAEHPQLLAMAEEGIEIYGVNYKDTPANAQGFLDELGDPYDRLAADPTGRTGLDWGLYGVPETFIIDGNGTVVKRFAGPITKDILETTIRPAIEQARAQSE